MNSNPQKEYIIAPTRDYAIHQWKRGETRIVAGGTTLIERRHKIREKIFLDISRCGLDAIELKRQGLRIGAAASFRQLALHPLLGDWAGGLVSHAARNAASPALRNMIRCGGNLLCGYAWAELPLLFLALDARLGFVQMEGKRDVSMEEFLAMPGTERNASGFLTHVDLPAKSREYCCVYRNRRPQVHGYSRLGLAISARRNPGKLSDLHICVSGCLRRVSRLPQLEAELTLHPPGSPEFDRSVQMALAGLNIVSTVELSADYARVLLAEYLNDAMAAIWRGGTQ